MPVGKYVKDGNEMAHWMGWILSKLFLCLQGFQTVLSYRTAQQPYFPPSGPPNKRQKNLTTYRAHIWSSPRIRKELTSYNIKKTEASLRYFVSITADPKYKFIQVGLLSGKFICWLRKKKAKLTSNTDAACWYSCTAFSGLTFSINL